MKVSICVTTFNEEKTIKKLILSLVKQTLKPDEIIIVDGLSTDKTVSIVNKLQKKYPIVRVVSQKCTRSEGRNLSVKMAKNEIIAMTDAGCFAKRGWLRNLVKPFRKGETGIVAGFYDMTGTKSIQKAFSVFLGINPSDFDDNFLPSTRSIAFTKKAFRKIGGFREDLKDTAEDSAFVSNAVKIGLNISRMKGARVEWVMPTSILEGIRKMYAYAKGDAKYGEWFHPTKKLASHNMKILLVFLRYLIGNSLAFQIYQKTSDLKLITILITFYLSWAYRKVYKATRNIQAALWGVVIQILGDLAVMVGFIQGYFARR